MGAIKIIGGTTYDKLEKLMKFLDDNELSIEVAININNGLIIQDNENKKNIVLKETDGFNSVFTLPSFMESLYLESDNEGRLLNFEDK